jgi:hypothetical protein
MGRRAVPVGTTTETPRCTLDIEVDADEALRPIMGRVLVHAKRTTEAKISLKLCLYGVAPGGIGLEDVATIEFSETRFSAGTTELPFEMPAQRRGWSWDDGGKCRCVWQLDATARLTTGQRMKVVLPLDQEPPEGLALRIEAEPRWAHTSPMSRGAMLASVIGVGSAGAAVAVLTGELALAAGAMTPLAVVLAGVAGARELMRKRRLGVERIACDRRDRGGYRAARESETLPVGLWMKPDAANKVEVAIRVCWRHQFSRHPAATRALIPERREAAQVEPGFWRAHLLLPPIGSFPMPFSVGGGGVWIGVEWELAIDVATRVGRLERLTVPLVVAIEG